MAKDVRHDDEQDTQTQIHALMAEVQMLRSAMKQSTTGSGLDAQALEDMFVRVAKISAEAQERAANPSNKNYPRISVFSYPEGDLARERTLKYPMNWGGEDVSLDTNTAEELELMHLAKPGVFTFTRTDGRPETLTVRADYGPGGDIQKLHFDFLKVSRETLPSIAGILRSALKVKTPEQQEVETLRAQIEAMKAASGAVQVTV